MPLALSTVDYMYLHVASGNPTTGTAKRPRDLAVGKLRPILVPRTEKNETDPRCTLTGCYRLMVAEDSTRCNESQGGPDIFYVPVYLGTSPSLSARCLLSRGLAGPTSPIDSTVLLGYLWPRFLAR